MVITLHQHKWLAFRLNKTTGELIAFACGYNPTGSKDDYCKVERDATDDEKRAYRIGWDSAIVAAKNVLSRLAYITE